MSRPPQIAASAAPATASSRMAVTGAIPALISPAPSQDGSRPLWSLSAMNSQLATSPWTSRAKLANVVSSTNHGNRHVRAILRGQERRRQAAREQHGADRARVSGSAAIHVST